MQLIVKSYNSKKRYFKVLINGRKIRFDLSQKINKAFGALLQKKIIVSVDFLNDDNFSSYHYQVISFVKITNLKSRKIIFEYENLRKQIFKFLKKHEFFLILDLEMTLNPPFRVKNFFHEIVQVGAILANNKLNSILKISNYVKTRLQKPLSKRTIRFLNIDIEKYEKEAVHFLSFYQRLLKLKQKYEFKIIVWGLNDIIALNEAYKFYKVKPLTSRNDFIDLQKMHVNYFNFDTSPGLFKTYEMYYGKEITQKHDAFDDAKVTFMIFQAFFSYVMRHNGCNNNNNV